MTIVQEDVYKRQALYYEFKDAGCDLTAGQKEVTGKYMDNFKRVWDMYTNLSLIHIWYRLPR